MKNRESIKQQDAARQLEFPFARREQRAPRPNVNLMSRPGYHPSPVPSTQPRQLELPF